MTQVSENAVIRRFINQRRLSVAGAFLAAALLPPAVAQTAGGETLQIKISDAASAGRLVNVPVNKSVLLDFNLPVREVRIAKPEIAEVAATSPKQLVLTGRSFGVTQLIVWVNEKEQHVFDVAVDLELDRLQASIGTAVPRARVKANSVLDSVVLSGTVPDAGSADKIVQIAGIYSTKVMNQMHVAGTQQVLLRCTVAEVNRRAIRQLGFNGWVAGDNVRDMFFLSNLAGINPSNIGAAEGTNVTARIPFLVGQGGIPVTGNTTLSFGFPRAEMQVFVQALRENGLLRILAEPNVVALNGQRATFLVGGEFPIPVPQGSASNAITIQFREFGVRLNFTPTIVAEDRIRLQVEPEVSEPDFTTAVTISGFTVPGLTQRRVQTVIELGSGQTFAIGGLLSEKTRGITRKVPGLGDIPVLGALFTSSDFQSDETELVILVTPEFVEPVSPDQITSVPGSSMVAPNDFELFLLGELEGQPAKERPCLKPRVHREWPVKPGDTEATMDLKLRGPLGPAGFEEGS